MPKAKYAYSPHRPPVLRFDTDGTADRLPELSGEGRPGGTLTDEEASGCWPSPRRERQEPWLEWAGKRRSTTAGGFDRRSRRPAHPRAHQCPGHRAVPRRQDVQRSLFGDPEQEYQEAVQFYRHDIDWTNRLILGDSLQVMASLARREDLAGKVQMIYMDPPYGIKFASNFQEVVAIGT